MWLLIVVGIPVAGLAVLAAYCRLTKGTCTSTADLSGKTAVVTGANSGIGYYTALDFAFRNAHVICTGRSKSRIEDAVNRIKTETGNQKVIAMVMDMSVMKSVREFVNIFMSTEPRLDILVNNAGIYVTQLERTEEGLESAMATNHLGHFLLTNLLLDVLRTCKARVVNVSSYMHRFDKLELDNLNSEKYFPVKHIYANTKLCNVLFTRELAHREQDISAFSLHPGAVITNIWGSHKAWLRVVVTLCGWVGIAKSSEEGALTSIYCAVQEGIENASGEYFADCKQTRASHKARDMGLAKKVWEISETFTGLCNT